MNTPNVDILLPYWGEFDLLKKAVDSVLAQTEQDWRLLIVDDKYPSLEASEHYDNHPDSRIKYTRHPKNLGLVKNFNYVLDQAVAPYCTIFGCDDIMLPDYLAQSLRSIEQADFYQPGVAIIDDNGAIYKPQADRIKALLRPRKTGVISGEKVVTALCHGNWLYFPSILWRTSTLQKYRFDESRPNTQDISTEISILRDGGSMYLDNQVTFHYRRSATSFSSKAKGGTRFKEEKATFDDFSKEFSAMGWKRASRAARIRITSRIHQALN